MTPAELEAYKEAARQDALRAADRADEMRRLDPGNTGRGVTPDQDPVLIRFAQQWNDLLDHLLRVR